MSVWQYSQFHYSKIWKLKELPQVLTETYTKEQTKKVQPVKKMTA